MERALTMQETGGLTALGLEEMMAIGGGAGSAELAHDLGFLLGLAAGCLAVIGKGMYLSGGWSALYFF